MFEAIHKTWNVLVAAAAVIIAVAAGFLVLPAGSTAADEGIFSRLGQFVVAVLLGVLIYPVVRFNERRHARDWAIVTALFLAGLLVLFFFYRAKADAWTCRYDGNRVVIGRELTPHGANYLKENPSVTCEQTLMDHAGVVEEVWTKSSIDARRIELVLMHFGSLLLVALCIVTASQSAYCATAPAKSEEAARS